MSTESPDRLAPRAVPSAPLAPDACHLGPAAVRALLAQLPVAVLTTDRQGRVDYANEAALHEVGALPDAVGALLGRALLTGEVVRDEEVELDAPNGRHRWASVSVTAIARADGEIESAVLTMADVTDRKRAESWEPVMESLSRL